MARIAVIGLGKVGLPFASHMLSLGHMVFGFDKNEKITSSLLNGVNPHPWEDLGFDVAREKLSVGNNIRETLDHMGISFAFVVVPTPQDGKFLSSKFVIEALTEINAVKPMPVVVVSTLDPRDASAGFMRAGKFSVIYSPPLIRLGTVRADLADARILFLGGDADTAAEVEKIYYPNGTPKTVSVIRGSHVDIAMAKMAINATLSSRTAWANDVAARAVAIGADPNIVLKAVRADPRIGSSCMYAGPPPGGPCLPRDMDVWSSIPGLNDLADQMLDAHRQATGKILHQAQQWVKQNIGIYRRVALLGLTYNPRGLDITNSIGVALYKQLEFGGGEPIQCRAHDPAHAILPQLPGWDGEVKVEAELEPILTWADCVVVATLWDEYKNLEVNKPTLVLDWRG